MELYMIRKKAYCYVIYTVVLKQKYSRTEYRYLRKQTDSTSSNCYKQEKTPEKNGYIENTGLTVTHNIGLAKKFNIYQQY